MALKLIAKTLFGLEEILAVEVEAIGGRDIDIQNRAVVFSGDKKVLYEANLWCRTATRILYQIHHFKATDSNRLYRGISAVNWREYLNINSSFAIDAVVNHAAFDNSMFVAQRCKDAIVDQMRDKKGRRPSVDTKNPDLRIGVHIHKQNVAVSLDASGEPLFRRGYRTEGGKAPLSEVLAAGIIKLSGWNGAVPLVDPMCGSGTIAIEAAMIARNMAPGLRRKSFGFMRWKDYDGELWKKLIAAARERVIKASVKVIAADIDRKQCDLTKANAVRAGVGNDITVSRKAMAEFDTPPGPGVVIANPPYGERMRPQELDKLYRSIGDTLKQKYNNYDAYIITGNLNAAKTIGLRSAKRIKLYNGPLECRLLKFEVYQGSRKAKYRR